MGKLIHRMAAKYRYSLVLLKELVKTDFKLRYKGSALGYVWTLLRPMALFAILYLVFVNFMKLGSGIKHYAVYLLLGIVLWNYFTEVTMNGMSAIVGKGDLMRKLSFPRYVIVLAGSFSALINLVINLIVVGIFMEFNHVPLTATVALLPIIILELFIFALGTAFLLSALYVRLRDINYVWEVLLQIGFYATPVLYPLSMVLGMSEQAGKLMMMNPLAQILQDARYVTVTKETMTTWKLFESPIIAAIPVIVVAVVAFSGALYFRKRAPAFAEEV